MNTQAPNPAEETPSGLSIDRKHAEAYTDAALAGQLRTIARQQTDRRLTEIIYEAARRLDTFK